MGGAFAALVPAVATAQDDADRQQEAAELYKEGFDLYYAGEYAVAITKLKAGFELDPNAMFLYSISLSYSKLGNWDEALKNARKADEMGGMPDEVRDGNLGRMGAYMIAQRSEEVAEDIAKPDDAPDVCSTNDDCDEGYLCNIRIGACVERIGPDPEEPGEPLFSPIGWAGVGVGALGIGLTTGAIIVSAGLKDDIEEHSRLLDEDPDAADELGQQIRGRQTLGKVLLFSGIGAVAAGGGLVVYDLFFREDSDAEGSAMVPWFSTDGAGFSWVTRF